jgi:hypothetical protein
MDFFLPDFNFNSIVDPLAVLPAALPGQQGGDKWAGQ